MLAVGSNSHLTAGTVLLLLSFVCLEQCLAQRNGAEVSKNDSKVNDLSSCEIKIALIVCRDPRNLTGTTQSFKRRLDQTLVLIKSMLITLDNSEKQSKFPKNCLHINILSNQKSIFDQLNEKIYGNSNQWHSKFVNRMKLDFVPFEYPEGTPSWMFYSCRPFATARLFLAESLPTMDSVIYLDTDTLVLRSMSDLWEKFRSHDLHSLASVTPRYPIQSVLRKDPVTMATKGRIQINSSILLMNLTRMRSSGWTQKIVTTAEQFRSKLVYGDQDILEFYLDENPKEIAFLDPCWNFGPICDPEYVCSDIQNGIGVLHGFGGQFTSLRPDKTFYKIFKVFKMAHLSKKFNSAQMMKKLQTAIQNAQKTSKDRCSRAPKFEHSVLAPFLNRAKIGK